MVNAIPTLFINRIAFTIFKLAERVPEQSRIPGALVMSAAVPPHNYIFFTATPRTYVPSEFSSFAGLTVMHGA